MGINISDIKTEQDYHNAMRKASPFLFEYMYDYLQKKMSEDPKKKHSLEYQALVSIVEGDYERNETLMKKARQKRQMKVISNE